MNRATPQMRDFAERLTAHEAAGDRSADRGAFAVPDRMRLPLETLMGSRGHRALLMRALALAGAEIPWLRNIQVAEDGTLEGPDPTGKSVDPDEILEGRVILVAQLIGLLVTFIGEKLTLQLVRDVWPKLPAKNLRI